MVDDSIVRSLIDSKEVVGRKVTLVTHSCFLNLPVTLSMLLLLLCFGGGLIGMQWEIVNRHIVAAIAQRV